MPVTSVLTARRNELPVLVNVYNLMKPFHPAELLFIRLPLPSPHSRSQSFLHLGVPFALPLLRLLAPSSPPRRATCAGAVACDWVALRYRGARTSQRRCARARRRDSQPGARQTPVNLTELTVLANSLANCCWVGHGGGRVSKLLQRFARVALRIAPGAVSLFSVHRHIFARFYRFACLSLLLLICASIVSSVHETGS